MFWNCSGEILGIAPALTASSNILELIDNWTVFFSGLNFPPVLKSIKELPYCPANQASAVPPTVMLLSPFVNLPIKGVSAINNLL